MTRATSAARRFLSRVAALFAPGRAERNLAREVEAHLALIEDDLVARGQTRADARLEARRAFHGIEQMKERQRDERAFRALAGWPMDLKLGLRMAVRSPGLTLVAVIALAVAIGGGAAYLEFANDMFRPSIAAPGGDRLVGIITWNTAAGQPERHGLEAFRTWQRDLTLIEDLAAAAPITAPVTTADGRTADVLGVRVTASAFRLFPVAPVLGRPILDSDENPAAPAVAVIGHALWRARFNADPGVIGARVTIGDTDHTIVGVMPDRFGFPVNHNLWAPLRSAPGRAPATGPELAVFGRLAQGASKEAAQSQLASIRIDAGRLDDDPRTREVTAYVRAALGDGEMDAVATYAVNLAFLALLALCAANVATLVFGRTVTRESEITVRTALGASRGRIVSQLVAEALVLTSLAAIAGLAGARLLLNWASDVWVAAQGVPLPFWWDPRMTWETWLYAGALAAIAALIVGAAPGLKATGDAMQTRLKFAAAGATMKFGGVWTAIVIVQVGVTTFFLLMVMALASSILALERQYRDVAIDRGAYLTAWMTTDTGDGATASHEFARAREVVRQRILEAPSVIAATYTSQLPGIDHVPAILDTGGARTSVRRVEVGEGYFETFELTLVAGRDFTPREREAGSAVALVDQSFVDHVLGGRAAVGTTVREVSRRDGEPQGPALEIVGVVSDMSTAQHRTARDATLYVPIDPARAAAHFVVHAGPNARAEGLPAVAAAVRAVAVTLPSGTQMVEARTLDQTAGEDAVGFIFSAFGLVGAVAVLLATAGIYALVSFTLARRTREVGIRTALGASPRRIATGLLSRAMLQVGLGVLAGAIPGALILSSVVDTGVLRGLAAGAVAAVAVAGFLMALAAAACSVPLRRVLRIDPTQAMREG